MKMASQLPSPFFLNKQTKDNTTTTGKKLKQKVTSLPFEVL
jgi:hypothetical protein